MNKAMDKLTFIINVSYKTDTTATADPITYM